MSARCPHHSMSLEAHQASSCSTAIAAGLSTSTAPTRTNRAFTERARNALAAVTNSSMPLSRSSLAGSRTMGSPTGSGVRGNWSRSMPTPAIRAIRSAVVTRSSMSRSRSSAFCTSSETFFARMMRRSAVRTRYLNHLALLSLLENRYPMPVIAATHCVRDEV